MKEHVKRTVSKYDMFEYDSRIAVGVSGGKDSLTLLKILTELEANRPKAELVAISIDEGVVGYRDEALRLANKYCTELGVEIVTYSFNDLFDISMDQIARKDRDLSTCSYCGVLRRRALDEGAKKVDADRLATGHNLDDMAQSVLLNVLRGDMNRAASFNPGGQQLGDFVRRVKPLCEVPERETTLYAYLNGIEFQTIPCPYSEEATRSDVRRFLNRMEVKRPSTKFVTYQTGLKFKPTQVETQVIDSCERCGAPTNGTVCRVCQLLEGLAS